MDELELLRRLAETAEGEPLPPLRVTDAVMERLAHRRPAVPLWPFGIGVSVAAAVALAVMFGALTVLNDPLVEISIRLVAP